MNFFSEAVWWQRRNQRRNKKYKTKQKNFDVLKYDGVRAMKTGEVEYAIRCFKHALEIKDDLEIHDHLSIVYTSKGLFSEAYEELQTLSKAQPDNVQIFIRMANIAFMMENYGAMATACEKAILLDSENATAHYLYRRSMQRTRRRRKHNCDGNESHLVRRQARQRLLATRRNLSTHSAAYRS